MGEYIKVNVLEYVKKLLNDGVTPMMAEKFARIVARKGEVGEKVVTWSVDEKGNSIEEKVDTVTIDETTNEPDWVVTKATDNGVLVVDKNGKLNQWIIKDSVFKKKYELETAEMGVYKPKGGPQVFIQIPDNIILEQWGEEMKIASGGYINITNSNDMYGISKRDFDDTYRLIDVDNKNIHK